MKSSNGFSIVLMLLFVAILLSVFGAYALLQEKALAPGRGVDEITRISNQGASDEVEAIEQDLGSTDIDAADIDLKNLEKELDVALQE